MERLGFIPLIVLIIAVSLLTTGLLRAFTASHADSGWAKGLSWYVPG